MWKGPKDARRGDLWPGDFPAQPQFLHLISGYSEYLTHLQKQRNYTHWPHEEERGRPQSLPALLVAKSHFPVSEHPMFPGVSQVELAGKRLS